VRKILASESELEQRLEELLAERRQTLDEQAARLEQAVQDLERREQLLRDSRASIERLLRLGTSDLESREDELVQLMRDVTAREERVRADEAELARRREELGAVELKRAALERRERAVAQREEELASRLRVDARDVPSPLLAFIPRAGYRLHELEEDALRAGQTLILEDEEYLVARLGPSPLPNDRRRCAYLVRGPRRARPSDGSS
jgi:chromosome segregation ATPase